MGNQSVISIEAVIDYIESHLDGKLELETVAEAVHYSKYHLHRLFTETVGMTIHDYVQRRQLTEAAKLLVFSDKPIIEIAFICGYESQQSFSLAFKAMYKSPPAEYREERSFYPLQLRFILHRRTTAMEFTIQDIRLAEKKDIVDWMNLMRLALKVTTMNVVIYDAAEYDSKPPIKTIKYGSGDYISYKLGTSLHDTAYTSCHVSYTDPDSKETQTAPALLHTLYGRHYNFTPRQKVSGKDKE